MLIVRWSFQKPKEHSVGLAMDRYDWESKTHD